MFAFVVSTGDGALPAGYSIDADGVLVGPAFRSDASRTVVVASGVPEQLLGTDYRVDVLGDGGAGPWDLLLPVAPEPGAVYVLRVLGVDDITLDANGGTVDGSGSVRLPAGRGIGAWSFGWDDLTNSWISLGSGNAPSLPWSGILVPPPPALAVMLYDDATQTADFAADYGYDGSGDPTVVMPSAITTNAVVADGVLELSIVGPTTLNTQTHTVICRSNANAIGVELNSASPEGAEVEVVDGDGNANVNNITVTASGGEQVDRGASVVMSSPGIASRTFRHVDVGGVLQWLTTSQS